MRRVWRDLPLRRKGVIVATIPLVPLLVTTTLWTKPLDVAKLLRLIDERLPPTAIAGHQRT